MGISASEAELTHPASPWKYNMVKAIQVAAKDPDVHLATWLREGAPMGLARDIQP